MKEPLPLFLIIGFIATGIYLVAAHLLQEGLKKRSPALFEKLGQPHIILNNTPRHAILITRWLLNGDVSSLSTKDLVLYWLVRFTGVISLACFFIGAFEVLKISI
jgi:hypothetical protein